jgi:hypothetical protein
VIERAAGLAFLALSIACEEGRVSAHAILSGVVISVDRYDVNGVPL